MSEVPLYWGGIFREIFPAYGYVYIYIYGAERGRGEGGEGGGGGARGASWMCASGLMSHNVSFEWFI